MSVMCGDTACGRGKRPSLKVDPHHWTSTYDFALDLFHTAHEQRESFLCETEYEIFCQFANHAILACCGGCPDPIYLFTVATPMQIAQSFL